MTRSMRINYRLSIRLSWIKVSQSRSIKIFLTTQTSSPTNWSSMIKTLIITLATMFSFWMTSSLTKSLRSRTTIRLQFITEPWGKTLGRIYCNRHSNQASRATIGEGTKWCIRGSRLRRTGSQLKMWWAVANIHTTIRQCRASCKNPNHLPMNQKI